MMVAVLILIMACVAFSHAAGCASSCPSCPCFPRPHYTLLLPHNVQSGSPVAQFEATPPSSNPSSTPLSYFFSGSSDFSVASSTGIVSTTVALDYATMAQYSLTIQATDGTNASAVNITVTLLDASSIAGGMLVCTVETLVGEIREGVSASQVRLPTCFNGDGSVAQVSDLVFAIASGDPLSQFQVTPTGFVTNPSPLDYETTTSHTLVLSVQNSEMPPRSATITVIINVAPVNEFPPVFATNPIQLSASEAAEIGDTLGQIEASDMDAGPDGTLVYALMSPSSMIFVHPSSGSIALTNSLDFESAQAHNFTVVVTDSSEDPSSQQSSSAMLTLMVRDANDNPPVFSQGVYSASVREDAGTRAVVARPVCTDLDAGVSSAVTYSITAGNDDGKFVIDTMTGVLAVAATLDYDTLTTPRFFTLTIRCRETQSPHAQDEALVIIELTSLNEFYPDPGSPRLITIREDMQPGSRLLQVQGRDRDLGLAGTLRYFLDQIDSPTCPSDHLFMEESTGTLYLMTAFDFEVGSTSYDCIVSVWDSERPIHVAETDIIISVGNVNDASPECSPSVSSVEIPESSAVGSMVTSLSCRDPDSRTLQYSFTDSSVTKFDVSARGEISLRESLDFETQPLHILRIQVSDGEFSTNTTVYVSVAGSNEFPPVFSALAPGNCTIPENSLYGSLICTVLATDADQDMDGVVSYELVTLSSIFAIEQSTGQLYLVGDVDREQTNQITLSIRATDEGIPPLSAETAITVAITDENDNNPEISPLVLASISESATVGSLVTTVPCTDSDDVNLPNSQVSMELVNQFEELPNGAMALSVSPLFTVSESTGEIRTADQLDYETVRLYRLSLICRDSGTPSLASTSMVYVRVEPSNEHTPSFPATSYQITVPENSSISTSIFNIIATDDDSGADGEIMYSIVGATGDSLFWVDPQSGDVLVQRELRCDSGTRHSLRIRASDGGQPSREATVGLTISVDRCHLGVLTPTQSSLYVASLPESAAVGTAVLTATCTSSRALPASTPNYMLTEMSDQFQIDSVTGEVVVRSALDYEQATSHRLRVRCFDPNHLEVFADMVAQISVLPVNEHSPQFTQASYSVDVSEGAEPGASLATVGALDLDLGRDGEVRYSVEDSNVVLIDPDTGVVYLAQTLDYESINTHVVQITAIDNTADATLALSDTVELTINVLDANDNWPVCERTVYHVYTRPQATPPYALLPSPNCSDSDTGTNSQLIYSLSNSFGKFSASSTTGELTLLSDLDPEDTSAYRLSLLVRDSGDTPLSVTLLVLVDLVQPTLDPPTGDGPSQDYVDAEGRKNAVNFTLHDFSKPIWEESVVAMEKFLSAVARSVTSHCAIFPEDCSLLAGCSQFFGSPFTTTDKRKKRSTTTTSTIDETSNYANFIQPHVVILPDKTTELAPPEAEGGTQNVDTVSLHIQFYVKLPPEVGKSPYRTTNYVVPKATLSRIVQQDEEVIGAVVRNSVSPSLTGSVLSGWKVVASVCLGILSVALVCLVVAGVGYVLHKYKQVSQNRVVPFKKSKKQTSPQDFPKAKKKSSNVTRDANARPSISSTVTSKPSIASSIVPGPSQSASPTTRCSKTETTFSKPSMAHMFMVGRPSPVIENSLSRQNRPSVTSQSSSLSQGCDSDITEASMENQLSRSGGSSRRISSAELDVSHSSKDEGGGEGGGARRAGGKQECEEDFLDNFPFTRPGNPVRTNGLSIWKNAWR